jgi:hypothetical protein
MAVWKIGPYVHVGILEGLAFYLGGLLMDVRFIEEAFTQVGARVVSTEGAT